MGKIKKLLGVTAVLGAAVCGAAVYKKKYGMNITDDDDFDDDLNVDIKNKKVVDISTDGSDDESKKVTITFNKDKAKKVVSNTLDDIGDAMYTAKDKIVDTIGEEHVEGAKETVGKMKDKIVNTIGEDNITKAKSKINDVTDKAKEKADEIFTEENIDMAKDKMSDAIDKTKNVIKKATDKVKSIRNDSDEDFIDIDTYEEIDDMDESVVEVDSDTEEDAYAAEDTSPIINNEPVINDESPIVKEEPVIVDNQSPIIENEPFVVDDKPPVVDDTIEDEEIDNVLNHTDEYKDSDNIDNSMISDDLTNPDGTQNRGSDAADSIFADDIIDDISPSASDTQPEISVEDVTEVHAINNSEEPVRKSTSLKYDFLADEVDDL